MQWSFKITTALNKGNYVLYLKLQSAQHLYSHWTKCGCLAICPPLWLTAGMLQQPHTTNHPWAFPLSRFTLSFLKMAFRKGNCQVTTQPSYVEAMRCHPGSRGHFGSQNFGLFQMAPASGTGILQVFIVIQGCWIATSVSLVLEVRTPGVSALLHLCSRQNVIGICV